MPKILPTAIVNRAGVKACVNFHFIDYFHAKKHAKKIKQGMLTKNGVKISTPFEIINALMKRLLKDEYSISPSNSGCTQSVIVIAGDDTKILIKNFQLVFKIANSPIFGTFADCTINSAAQLRMAKALKLM